MNYGYTLSKNGKTICLGIADNMQDVLNRFPGGRYKLSQRIINEKTNKVEYHFENDLGVELSQLPHGLDLNQAMDILKKDGVDIWKAVVREDVEDLTEVLFSEIQKIWNS